MSSGTAAAACPPATARERSARLWLTPVAGAALALALPPLGFLPAALAPGLLFVQLQATSRYWPAFWRAWLFGFGFHLAGIYWVGIAFLADADRFGALAVPGVIALAATLAAIGALPLACMGPLRLRQPIAAATVFAALWCLGELARGRHGVQFPWNPLSLTLVASDTSLQVVALVGTTAGSFLVAWLAALVGVASTSPPARRTALALLVALVLAVAAFGLWRLASHPAGRLAEPPVTIRIVQANIAQHHKWDPALRRSWFEKHLDLARLQLEPASPGRPDIVVWPESSVPYSLDAEPEVRRLVGSVVRPGGAVILGSDFFDGSVEPPILRNSVYAVADDGRLLGRYDKVDLVPFGEFLPLRPLFGALGLEALAVGSMDFQPGPGRTTLALPGLPPASPLVCFEAAFPGRGTDGTGRARWIANVTNDAWFGISSGPYQHAGMARMRAVETGLPLVRAANTGISMITDPLGRVLESLPLGATGTIDAMLPAALPAAPPATRWPWLSPLLIALALLGAGAVELARRRAGRGDEDGSRQ